MNRFGLPDAVPAADGGESVQRVLIIDDEPRMRSSLRRLLTRPGREIAECATGSEAIDTLGRTVPDLVLLDIGLPDVSGLDVMRWMRDRQLDSAVIIVSGDGNFESAVRALRYGALEFVRKPDELDLLPDKVDAALDRRRLLQQNRLMTARLGASERLHRFLVDNSPDLVFTLDERGRFVYLNPRVETMLGWPREEKIGSHWTTLVHEHDRESVRNLLDEQRADARPNGEFELRLLRRADEGSGKPHVVALVSTIDIYAGDGSAPVGERRLEGTFGVARDITERKRAEETVSRQALHDQLTGLPNRRLFKDHLELALAQAARRARLVGVMFIDLDGFKFVNDTYGHLEGDALLKAFAQRVRGCVRAGDTVARQGGDEFTVLLPDLIHADDAMIIANKIFAELQRPFGVAGREFRMTASIGIAVYPRDGANAEQLLRNADIAMYKVKSSGKNGGQLFTAEMDAGWQHRMALENDLRHAVDQGELVLHFQPQFGLREGRMVGAEVLLRWQHPRLGLLPPADFIGIAEESGLISALSDWAIEKACRQFAQWLAEGRQLSRVSVNLSALEFRRADIVEHIAGLAERHALPRDALEIEITENVLLHDAPTVLDKLERMRQRGVRIAIDDFGTRQSSLNVLRRFPINSLKIDQSFVRDITSSEDVSPVIHAIVAIARGFGLDLVAEGVETPVQREVLAALGCDAMQGYLFAQPADADVLARLL